jgi:hypothetical protein
MSSLRGIGRSLPGGERSSERAAVAYEQKRPAIRSSRLGVGTLACGRCDAPIAIGPEPLSARSHLTCPFCAKQGPVRDFLSLASPARPARVVVRVAQPASRPLD